MAVKTQFYHSPPTKTGRRYGSFASKPPSQISKTQAALARITAQTSKTQTAVASIFTQHPVAKITQYIFRTRTGRRYGIFAKFGQTSKTQAAIAKITVPTTKTQVSVGRVRAQVSRTQLTLARVRAQVSRTTTALGNITLPATSDIQITAIANIVPEGTHSVGKITQYFRREATGRRYGSFASKAQLGQSTKTQSAKGSVRVTVTISGSITLAWDAAAGATGYKVYVGTSSGIYNYSGSPTDVGNVTQYQFTLFPTNTYYFAVTAYNAIGESGFSNEISQYIQAGMYAKASLVFQNTKTQSGLARVTTSVSQTQTAIAYLLAAGTQERSQTALGSILITVDQSQNSVATLIVRTTQTLGGVGRIGLLGGSATITSVAKITNSVIKTQTAVAIIASGAPSTFGPLIGKLQGGWF